jgi:hypothetical protein
MSEQCPCCHQQIEYKTDPDIWGDPVFKVHMLMWMEATTPHVPAFKKCPGSNCSLLTIEKQGRAKQVTNPIPMSEAFTHEGWARIRESVTPVTVDASATPAEHRPSD